MGNSSRDGRDEEVCHSPVLYLAGTVPALYGRHRRLARPSEDDEPSLLPRDARDVIGRGFDPILIGNREVSAGVPGPLPERVCGISCPSRRKQPITAATHAAVASAAF